MDLHIFFTSISIEIARIRKRSVRGNGNEHVTEVVIVDQSNAIFHNGAKKNCNKERSLQIGLIFKQRCTTPPLHSVLYPLVIRQTSSKRQVSRPNNLPRLPYYLSWRLVSKIVPRSYYRWKRYLFWQLWSCLEVLPQTVHYSLASVRLGRSFG